MNWNAEIILRSYSDYRHVALTRCLNTCALMKTDRRSYGSWNEASRRRVSFASRRIVAPKRAVAGFTSRIHIEMLQEHVDWRRETGRNDGNMLSRDTVTDLLNSGNCGSVYKEQCGLIESLIRSYARVQCVLARASTDWHPPHPFARHLLLGAYEIYAIPPARYTRGRAKGQVICETPSEPCAAPRRH